MNANTVLAASVISYIIGAIPFGWIIGKFHGIDLRDEGSGGIGATNVGRTIGKKWAIVTFLLDTSKGVCIVVLAQKIDFNLSWAVGMGLIAAFGHCFPLILGGKGGKAVATSLGILLASQWHVGIIAFGTWLLVVLITRYVSVASISAVSAVIAIEWLWRIHIDPLPICWIFTGMALLVIIMHIPNIKRLLKGDEKRFVFGGGKNHVV